MPSLRRLHEDFSLRASRRQALADAVALLRERGQADADAFAAELFAREDATAQEALGLAEPPAGFLEALQRHHDRLTRDQQRDLCWVLDGHACREPAARLRQAERWNEKVLRHVAEDGVVPPELRPAAAAPDGAPPDGAPAAVQHWDFP